MIPVLTTNPRSGTHFLKNLIAAALDIPPLERDLSGQAELRAALSATQGQKLIYGHFRFSQHAAILDEKLFPDLRIVVLTRHPVDRLISQLSFEKALGGHLADPTHSAQRLASDLFLGHWDGKPWQSGHIVNDYAAWHNFLLRDLVTNWIVNRNCRLVKFEDLISSPARVLAECLSFFGVALANEAIACIIERITFETLSGGRSPGQIDPQSHYRKGTVGEWLEVFPPADVEILKEKYGIEFFKAGYLL